MANKITCTCGHSWNKSSSSKKDEMICHICGKNNMKNGGWLDAYDDAPQAENGIEGTMGGLTDIGFNYNGAWGGPSMQFGGNLAGAVGSMYARTGGIPSNGPYAKKTKASAQNGMEMKFYQEGLDWKPKNISRDGSVTKDDMGYWNPENWGEPVEIGSNDITMQGVYEPLLGISDTGDTQMMYPGEDYTFDGESVTEYPVAQKGINLPTPTTADSLKVYNAAFKLVDYYKNDKRHYAPRIDEYTGNIERAKVDEVGQKNLDMFRKMYKELADPGFKYKGSMYEFDYGLPKQELLKKVGQAIAQSKSASPGTAYYKDAFPSKIDINAPSAYVDSRISPQGFMYFDNIIPRNPEDRVPVPAGSITGAWYYDPIAIKPVAMRTPQEKAEFNRKYGKPKSRTAPKPTVKQESKKQESKKPELKKEEPIKKVEQPKPIEKKQNIYEGSPVYSPGAGIGAGSTLVGFANQKGDTTYIKPEDYERFAVPKYGKEFIESKKKKNGGWLEKYK